MRLRLPSLQTQNRVLLLAFLVGLIAALAEPRAVLAPAEEPQADSPTTSDAVPASEVVPTPARAPEAR